MYYIFCLLDINGGFRGRLVIQGGGGGGRGGQKGRAARTKAFKEKKAKERNEKKTAKLEAAKLFVYNVDKVSQYYLMKISPVRYLN